VTPGRFIVALLVGLALIDSAGPQITRHSPPAIAWLWLGGALLLVGWLALVLWHRRRLVELRKQWLVSEDWLEIPGWSRDSRWACPRCGAECPSLSYAEQHLDPLTSPCAALQQHIEQVTPEVKATVPGAGWPAGIVGDDDSGREAGDDAA
jgi:hypothetical protein